MKTNLRTAFLSVILIAWFGFKAEAQVAFGAGIAGLKYLGTGSNRPVAIGLNANLAIEFSEKTRLLLTPTYYIPVNYTSIQVINVNNVPTTANTNEEFKILQLTALYAAYLIGNNEGGGLYVAAGPSIALYNTKVTRQNFETYDYSGDFKDYMLDARAGVEIPLGILRLYAELEIDPIIVSDFKSNSVDYKPNKGTILAATAGVRIRL